MDKQYFLNRLKRVRAIFKDTNWADDWCNYVEELEKWDVELRDQNMALIEQGNANLKRVEELEQRYKDACAEADARLEDLNAYQDERRNEE